MPGLEARPRLIAIVGEALVEEVQAFKTELDFRVRFRAAMIAAFAALTFGGCNAAIDLSLAAIRGARARNVESKVDTVSAIGIIANQSGVDLRGSNGRSSSRAGDRLGAAGARNLTNNLGFAAAGNKHSGCKKEGEHAAS